MDIEIRSRTAVSMCIGLPQSLARERVSDCHSEKQKAQ
jgi:hypothetical protein